MLIVPRLMRAVVRLHSNETTVVAAVGLSFAFALLARWMNYSVALGAFLAGALVAESGAAKIIEHRIEPVRDVFAAVFFVSVGMLIDPRLVWENLPAVLVLTVVVVVGKLIGVAIGTFIAGYGVRTSVQAAMSLGQIGEFSFIIAGVGLSLGVIRPFLYPGRGRGVGADDAADAVADPLRRGASPTFVDGRLPHALQTYASLYGAWVNGLRATPEHRTAWARIRRLVLLLVVDVALLAAIVIAVLAGAGTVCCGSRARSGTSRRRSRACCWSARRSPSSSRSSWARSASRARWASRWRPRRCPRPRAARASWISRRRRGVRCW